MENKSHKKKKDDEEKVGVVPISEIKGSDADTAYQEEGSVEEQKQQFSKSDADTDQQTKEQ